MTVFVLLAVLLVGGAIALVVWPLRQQTLLLAQGGRVVLWWKLAVPLVLGMVAAVIGLYAWLGNPGAVVPLAPAPTGAGVGPAQIEAMVARLAQRLERQPDDVDGWRMLARSYESLGRFKQAVDAYQQLLQRQPDDPDILTDYAVTLGMAKGQSLAGEPEAILAHVLQIKPDHVQALALSGSAAFERGDYAAAIRQWRKLLAQVPPGDDVRQTIEENIDKAKALQQRGLQRGAP